MPDVMAAMERVEAIGGRVLRDFIEPDEGLAVVADPDGNEFCLIKSKGQHASSALSVDSYISHADGDIACGVMSKHVADCLRTSVDMGERVAIRTYQIALDCRQSGSPRMIDRPRCDSQYQ